MMPTDDTYPPTEPDVDQIASSGFRLIRKKNPMNLSDIPRQYHVKRAIEVALTGGHSTTIVMAENAGDAEQTMATNAHRWMVQQNSAMEHNVAVVAYEDTPWPDADVTVYFASMMPTDDTYPSTEPDAVVMGRVENAQQRPPVSDDLCGACQSLLKACRRQLDLTDEQVARTIQVAKTIARLAGRDTIGPAHLAEAIQYRGRRVP